MVKDFSNRELKQVYEIGYDLLVDQFGANVKALKQALHTPTVYQRIEQADRKTLELSDLYQELVMSLRNRIYVSGLVQEGDVEALRGTLYGFDPQRVVKKYIGCPEKMAVAMRACLRRQKSANWPKKGKKQWALYCRGAYDGAMFMGSFPDPKAFFGFAKQFDGQPADRWKLVEAIAYRISGMGCALACNFLKESGLKNYSKPDTQVMGLLQELHLPAANQFEAFLTMARIAQAASVTDFEVDKILWLIATNKWTQLVSSQKRTDRKTGKKLKAQFVDSVKKLHRGKHG